MTPSLPKVTSFPLEVNGAVIGLDSGHVKHRTADVFPYKSSLTQPTSGLFILSTPFTIANTLPPALTPRSPFPVGILIRWRLVSPTHHGRLRERASFPVYFRTIRAPAEHDSCISHNISTKYPPPPTRVRQVETMFWPGWNSADNSSRSEFLSLLRSSGPWNHVSVVFWAEQINDYTNIPPVPPHTPLGLVVMMLPCSFKSARLFPPLLSLSDCLFQPLLPWEEAVILVLPPADALLLP